MEKIQFVAVEQDPYNVQVVGEQIRAKQRALAFSEQQAGLTEEVQALRRELYELRRAIAGPGVAPVAPPAGPLPEPVPDTNPLPTVVPPDPVPTTGPLPSPAVLPPPDPVPPVADSDPALSKWAVGLLQQRCASCHNDAKRQGEFALFAADNVTLKPLTAGKMILIDQVLYANEMPKAPKPKLTADEYNRMRAWIQSGSEGIRQIARASDRQ